MNLKMEDLDTRKCSEHHDHLIDIKNGKSLNFRMI